MREWQSQAHVKWYCRFHIVIVSKYRRKVIYGALRRELGEIFKELCRRLEIELVEGHVMPDTCICIWAFHRSTVWPTPWESSKESQRS